MDEVVSAVYFEGEVFIFTKQGTVYRMRKNNLTSGVTFERVARNLVR